MASLADDLRGGFRSAIEFALVFVQMPDNVFHHHHRAIHHHSEIECAQGKKIGRYVAQIQPDRCKEQGEWNGEGDDESGANIEKKQTKDNGDQNHAFDQVMHHCVQGEMQQIAAIQHGYDFHAGRQDAVVEFVDFLVNRLERRLLLGAFAHQHPALDDIRLVDDAPVLHVVGSGHMAQPDLGALGHVRDVFHPKGRAGLGL